MEEAQVKELDLQFETYKENIDKFSNSGNKAAGTRARKALAEINKDTGSKRTKIS